MADALPESASTAVFLHLAASRIKELQHLDTELANCKPGKGGRCYQKLPRHMQRRALSTNPKRLPKRLRQRHIAEGEPPKPSKRPASKHRPRPRKQATSSTPGDSASAARSRVEDYTRRQRACGGVWLETHLWHAKRFHMARRWGYILPLRPTQKMYRPTLRAVGQRCVVQDVSFICGVEVRGAGLLTALQACVAPSARGHLQELLRGGAWRACTLYTPNRWPAAAVCEVQLWKLRSAPVQRHGTGTEKNAGDDKEYSLWMWVHPASYSDLLNLLCQVFSLQRVADEKQEGNSSLFQDEDKENSDGMDVDDDAQNDEDLSDVKTVTNNGGNLYSEDQIPKSKAKRKHRILEERLARANSPDYVSEDKKISAFCLKDTLNRFRLRGPEAYTVLKSVLVPSSVTPEYFGPNFSSKKQPSAVRLSDSSVKIDQENLNPVLPQDATTTKTDTAVTTEDSSSWWEKYYADAKNQQEVDVNATAWAVEPEPLEDFTLPLIVRDPRVLLPCKRAKLDPSQAHPGRRRLGAGDVAPHSPLHDLSVRQALLTQRRSDHEINSERHKSAVPGVVMPLTNDEARVPVVLLLQRLRRSSDDKCDVAYDIIVPGGWGSNFWTAIIYAGAVAVGVDSEIHFMREEHTPPPPYLLPDLPAGRRFQQLKAKEMRDEHFRLPPDKRPNFIKLGVQFPFSFSWSKLVASLIRDPTLAGSHEKEIGTGFSDEVLLQLGLVQDENQDTNGDKDDENYTVLRDRRSLKTLDFVSCCSGSRRRIFRGLDQPSKQSAEISENTNGSAPENLSLPECKENLAELQEAFDLIKRTCQSHLVRVQVTLIGKGTIEPMALICRPSASDMQQLKEALTNEQSLGQEISLGVFEPSRLDPNEEERKELKHQHQKDQTKLQKLRKEARRRVRCQQQVGDGSLQEALSEAVERVHQDQQDRVARSQSYTSTMESLWLLSPDAPLQQCSRLIVGCLTDASFSLVRGCGVGQGFVALASLLPVCEARLNQWHRHASQTHDKTQSKKLKLSDGSSVAVKNSISEAGQRSEMTKYDGVDVDLPFVQERGIAVLVRNRNSLHYRFGLLTVCSHQPPP